jgi:pyruvate dehydrogenase E1 component alpha subunit
MFLVSFAPVYCHYIDSMETVKELAAVRPLTDPKVKLLEDFSKETYLFWYERMLLMRKFEEKAGQLYGQQKIRGFCHLYNGQEACIAGAITALDKEDKYITAYRDHAHPIALGTPPQYIMAELFAKVTGTSKGKGGSMHMFDKERHLFGGHGIVGGQIPLGVGIAFAEKYKKTTNLCITFMGDGAVRQGAFHEALNLAMLYQLPVIFVIENNGYAMGTSVNRSSNVTELYKLGAAYDMPSESVDGMDVTAVHRAVAKAAKKARNGLPGLLELKTYRYKGHSISDPAKYRSKEEVETYKQQGPIERVRTTILAKQMADEEALGMIDQRVKQQVSDAVAFADTSASPQPAAAYEDVYAQKDYPFLKS